MSNAVQDSALETLLLPVFEGRLAWPSDGALFLNARDGWPLHRQPLPGLVAEQGFKPAFDALQRSGINLLDEADGRRFPLVLLLPPRQRSEARALYARALSRLTDGGVVLACQANDEGAKSAEADLAKLIGPLTVMSKNKCRVFWSQPGNAVNAALVDEWRDLDAVRPIADGRFLSRPGVFAWDRIDVANKLLALSFGALAICVAAQPTSAPATAICRRSCCRAVPASPRWTVSRPMPERWRYVGAISMPNRSDCRLPVTGTMSPADCWVAMT